MIREPLGDGVAGTPHAQMIAAAHAAEQALRLARQARRAIGRLAIPAETQLRETIGAQLDAVLERLDQIERATGLALRVMSDTPYLSLVEAEMRRLEALRLDAEIGRAAAARVDRVGP